MIYDIWTSLMVQKNYFKILEPKLSLVNITQALHWVDFVMATGSFSSHWISYLYLYINALLRRKSHFAVINEKLVPFISWMGIECSRSSGAITCFIAAGSLLQLSKCLGVNSSRPYVQNFVLLVSATFPIREKFNSERLFSDKMPN